MRRLSVVASIFSLRHALCYSPNSKDRNIYQGHLSSVEVAASASPSSHLVSSFSQCYSRKTFSIVCSLSCAAALVPLPLAAKEQPTNDSDVSILKEATEALSSLLQNWQKATIDCTYADVPRELLEAKNKEKLLEKVTTALRLRCLISVSSCAHFFSTLQASEFALFDKSTSIVSCKRTNRIVRDYIGATGKGPLVGAEKRLLRKTVVKRVDEESLDEYFSGTIQSFVYCFF